VIINNTGSERHADQIRQALETYTSLPVLGAMPRLPENPLPERQMGLTLRHAAPEQEAVLDLLAEYAARHIDLEKLLLLARASPGVDADAASGMKEPKALPGGPPAPGARPRIGFVRDDALWFYYGENLEALRQAGAELAELSLLAPDPWPELDGLYLGGGFPEAHAAALASSPHLAEIRALSEAGRPVYAECGGLMILGQALAVPSPQGDVRHEMAGLLPVRTRVFPRPQGLGYVEATVLAPNPFHPEGSVWRGHEFHYSRCELAAPERNFLLRLSPGTGMARSPEGFGLDGLCVRRTFASYTHLFAPAVPHWAENFVRAALTR
jgi:cobyrinic acid a,c-diamide synthase